MIRLTVGTKQYVVVPIKDLTGVVSALTTATFDVEDEPHTTWYYSAQSAVVSGMDIYCLLNTSATGPTSAIWPAGRYQLFVTFPVTPEIPRLGPIDLLLVD